MQINVPLIIVSTVVYLILTIVDIYMDNKK